MTKKTRVCSNHFVHGTPTNGNPDPFIYMKGYPMEIYQRHNIMPPTNKKAGKKRNEPIERKFILAVSRNKLQTCTLSPTPEHDYELVNCKDEGTRTHHPMECTEFKYRKLVAQLRKEKEELQ